MVPWFALALSTTAANERDETTMNRKYIPWYLVAVSILVAALLVSGVSGTVWLFVLVALLCPLMMMLMMGGMRGGGGSS